MTPELTALALAALLHVVQLLGVAIPTNIENLTKKKPAPTDGTGAPKTLAGMVTPRTERGFKAFNNHTEWLPLFAIAVILVHLTDQSTGFTVACAWVYLAARTIYVPLYYFDVSPWRTVAWAAGFFSTVALIIAVLV